MSNNSPSFVRQISEMLNTAIRGKLSGTSLSLIYGLEIFDPVNVPPENILEDEFWARVQQSYTVSPELMNLNNGGVSPQPRVVQETFERYNRFCNLGPSYYMWQILDKGREAIRAGLAELAGCEPGEIAINRNSTEAINTIIYGLNLQKGDEVVLSKQDYPNVVYIWKMLEQRNGIVLKWVDLELPAEEEDLLVQAYKDAFTGKTRLVSVTHIINWNGQLMPVKKIAAAAHQRGIEVLVDGAHSFALLDFKIPDLDCDYFATSLHKWLGAPFGTGLLYVKKEKIRGIYPIFPDDKPLADDIRKFERMGTRSFATEMAIGSALDFHMAIGSKRKEDRLRYLKNYWMEQVKDIPGVHLHTSLKPEFSCVIGLFSIGGYTPAEIETALFIDYKIHAVGITWENISGVRVTPNVYTSELELDKLVSAIGELADKNNSKFQIPYSKNP
jgi:selenocysteine lyase/cysteine desulfurase